MHTLSVPHLISALHVFSTITLSQTVKPQANQFRLEQYGEAQFRQHKKGFTGHLSIDEMLSWSNVCHAAHLLSFFFFLECAFIGHEAALPFLCPAHTIDSFEEQACVLYEYSVVAGVVI